MRNSVTSSPWEQRDHNSRCEDTGEDDRLHAQNEGPKVNYFAPIDLDTTRFVLLTDVSFATAAVIKIQLG